MKNYDLLANIRYVNIGGQNLKEVLLNDTKTYLDNDGKITEIVPSTDKELTLDDLSRITQDHSSEKGSEIIEEIKAYLRKYVYLREEEEYTLIAVIALLSYSVSLFDRIPYLWFQAGKGTGKTTLMSVLKPLVYNPVFISNVTASSLFRVVHESSPTLFLDEVEALAARSSVNHPFIQILNSGYQKDGKVTRTRGNKVQSFNTYGLKIMAGISPIAETVEDRSIRIALTRPEDGAEITPYISQNTEEAQNLQAKIHSSVWRSIPEINTLIKNPSEILIDKKIGLRDYDKWMPVLLVAKQFSSGANNYFELLQQYALKQIEVKKLAEQKEPTNMCREIIREYLLDFSDKSKIPDNDFYFFSAEEIQEVIRTNDLYNKYRDKTEITLTLKKLGIETTRRRFGNGPVSLYKIPKSILL